MPFQAPVQHSYIQQAAAAIPGRYGSDQRTYCPIYNQSLSHKVSLRRQRYPHGRYVRSASSTHHQTKHIQAHPYDPVPRIAPRIPSGRICRRVPASSKPTPSAGKCSSCVSCGAYSPPKHRCSYPDNFPKPPASPPPQLLPAPHPVHRTSHTAKPQALSCIAATPYDIYFPYPRFRSCSSAAPTISIRTADNAHRHRQRTAPVLSRFLPSSCRTKQAPHLG